MNTGKIKIIALIVVSIVFCRETPASFQIDADFPGGNIIVVSIRNDSILLKQDLRDSDINWFYWSFRVKGAAGRTLHFEFTNGTVIASRGPAISVDDGITWKWLGDLDFSETKFQYSFAPDENEVYFGMGMNYTEKSFKRFLANYEHHANLKIETLCLTKKGRNVELLRIFNHTPDFKIVFTARHHCGEMMANYVLEGIIDVALSDTEDGRWLRNHCDFFIIPFVDKDGVEDGDQGKNRRPHDHYLDYNQRIYTEIQAITNQIPKWLDGKPVFFLDMHCPWVRGGSDGNKPENGTSEYFYFVGLNPEHDTANIAEKLNRFGNVLETVKKGAIPYQTSFNLLYGTSWNTSATHVKTPCQQSPGGWAATLPNVVFSSHFELPFANASGVTVDINSARELGHDLASAIRVYLENEIVN